MSSNPENFLLCDTEKYRTILYSGTLHLLYEDDEVQTCKKVNVALRLQEVLAQDELTRRFWCSEVAKCATDKERDEKIQAVYTQCKMDVLKNMDRSGSEKLVSLAML
jgi:hypothetical protein